MEDYGVARSLRDVRLMTVGAGTTEVMHEIISKIVIERPGKKAHVSIHTARPGVVIGKKGADIEKMKKDLELVSSGEVQLNIVEVRKPELDAHLIAEEASVLRPMRVGRRQK